MACSKCAIICMHAVMFHSSASFSRATGRRPAYPIIVGPVNDAPQNHHLYRENEMIITRVYRSLGPQRVLCPFDLFVLDDKQPDEELADIAKEDKNLMEIMVSGEESAKGGRRGSSVNASRHRSSTSLSNEAENRVVTLGPPRRAEDGCSNLNAENEPSPDAGSRRSSRHSSQSTRSPSSNNSSLQTHEEKRLYPTESSSPGSRERSPFPYTRRSSQIRPLLSSIEASIRAASEERSGARVASAELK